MKNKFSLCFRPVAVEAAEDDTDVVVSHDHHHHHYVSYDSTNNIIVPSGNTGTTKSSAHKNRKLIRRKGVAIKHFPSLFKAIVFPDPLKNIHQLELQLKNRKAPVKNRKRIHVLDSESGKPQITAEENCSIDVTSEPKNMRSITHEKPKTTTCSGRVSFLYTIILALFATIFLGRIGAIIFVSLGLSFIHYWLNVYFRPATVRYDESLQGTENLKI